MEKVHHKLVRDLIPAIIEKDGRTAITHILNDEEYVQQLERKLYEEYLEVIQASTPEEKEEELADLLEVMCAIAKVNGKSLEDIISCMNAKREKRGGFEKKIFLEKVIDG